METFKEIISLLNKIEIVFPFITAICSVISLVSILLLLLDRKERHRPYLQATFELKRSSLACITIKNVGEVPAYLTGLSFNDEFIKQLSQSDIARLGNRNDLQLTIFPGQQWVISLDIITSDIFKFKNRILKVKMIYKYNRKKIRKFKEESIVDFDDYKYFMVYISDINELRETLRKTNDELHKITKILNKGDNLPVNIIRYNNVDDAYSRTIIEHNKKDNG